MTAVLDSSGWMELLSGTKRADLYRPVLRAKRLYVPAIVRYEVVRYTLAHAGPAAGDLALRALAKFEQVAIDAAVADAAASLAHEHKLSAADALVYAAARHVDAELWTQDQHFANLPNVRFFPKRQ